MPKFNWENGTKISDSNVEINGNIFEVNPAQYEGKTPLSAANLNAMQDGIFEEMWEPIEIPDEELDQWIIEEDNKYLGNKEKKQIFNGKMPRYERRFEWKHYKTVTGFTEINLPDDYNELCIVLHSETGVECLKGVIPKTILSKNVRYYTIDGRFMFNDNGLPIAWGADAEMTTTTYKLYRFYVNGQGVANAVSEIYYR